LLVLFDIFLFSHCQNEKIYKSTGRKDRLDCNMKSTCSRRVFLLLLGACCWLSHAYMLPFERRHHPFLSLLATDTKTALHLSRSSSSLDEESDSHHHQSMTRLNAEATLSDSAAATGTGENDNPLFAKSDNILEDSTGHINGLLAERIFHWEQALREKQKLPPVDYSIRSGLRLVEQLVQEILEEKKGIVVKGSDDEESLYLDLIQEGLMALLDAMQQYRDEKQGEQGFARYAQTTIRQQLDKSLSLNLSNRPMRLPRSVVNMVQKAKATAQELKTTSSKNPTLEQVAEQLHIPADQLRDYLRWVKLMKPPTLSMESTMEIPHPDESVLFQDMQDWEKTMESMMTDLSGTNAGNDMTSSSSSSSTTPGKNAAKGVSSSTASPSSSSTSSLRRSEPPREQSTMSEYYLDNPELQDLEGDDQAWITQQEAQYGAGTLSDVIPDLQEPSPDDLALQEMIRHDVSEFLSGTLSDTEHEVIRSVFGLDTGKQSTLKKTAAQLNMTTEQVSVLLAGGLQKLRESYQKRYVEPYLDNDDTPGRVVDSV